MDARTGDLPTKQERSKATRRKLVASCLALVERRPFDQVTVADIATGAGVSVGVEDGWRVGVLVGGRWVASAVAWSGSVNTLTGVAVAEAG